MKIKQLREKTLEELEDLLDKARKDLVDMRFQLSINKLKSNADISKTKKHIARIKTLIKQKQVPVAAPVEDSN